MDSVGASGALSPADAAEFVRFCYRRRSVGWPELYDEMWLVACRRLFRGWGLAELAEHGIGFSLFETAALASLVAEVVTEEQRVRRLRPAGFGMSRAALGRPAVESSTGADEGATRAAIAAAS